MPSINYERSRRYFTYRADHPGPINGFTTDQWESLSPGMRRQIVRDFTTIKPRYTITIETSNAEDILRVLEQIR